MKTLLLALALVCAGCTEQAVEKSFADPCVYCGKPYHRITVESFTVDSVNQTIQFGNCAKLKIDKDTITALTKIEGKKGWSIVPIPKRLLTEWYNPSVEPDSMIEGCGQIRDFAAWCQKAHPEVWREYHKTITGGR